MRRIRPQMKMRGKRKLNSRVPLTFRDSSINGTRQDVACIHMFGLMPHIVLVHPTGCKHDESFGNDCCHDFKGGTRYHRAPTSHQGSTKKNVRLAGTKHYHSIRSPGLKKKPCSCIGDRTSATSSAHGRHRLSEKLFVLSHIIPSPF